MNLTRDAKNVIDSMSYKQLLSKWRFAPAGDPWFRGETGGYWAKRMAELRSDPKVDHTKISKEIGWGKP